jgi:hydroxymethylpyrimidine pyrophosphatase-like HAD family hydrolase
MKHQQSTNHQAQSIDIEKRLLKNNIDQVKELCKDLRVIYSDVDGTVVGPEGSLFLNAEKEITIHPARAVAKILENKLDMVLVSGRSRRQLGADARILGFKNYISELGCLIVHGLGNEVYALNDNVKTDSDYRQMNNSIYCNITDSGAPALLLSKYKGFFEYHTPWSEGRECTHVFRGYINIVEAKKLLKKEGYDELTLIDNGIIHRRGGLDKSIVEIHAYHLLPENAGKEKGIKKDLEIRNYSKKNAIAIGDALCDVTMADEVSALFLVQNAITEHSPEVACAIENYKNVFITTNKMGNGFAEIVYALLGF